MANELHDKQGKFKKKPKTRPLTVKQKKFVALKVQGLPAYQAYREAGYSAPTMKTATSESSKLQNKPSIQAAIDKALAEQNLTPEFAVKQIGGVASMELDSRSASSILKANEKILELHGWRKDEKPTVTLQVNQFFSKSRSSKQVIDGETA